MTNESQCSTPCLLAVFMSKGQQQKSAHVSGDLTAFSVDSGPLFSPDIILLIPIEFFCDARILFL
jgi:hypothetical protein